MIDKLNGFRHLKITSDLDKNKQKNQDSNQRGSQNKNSSEEHNEEKEHFDVSPFDFNEIIKQLNENKYYKTKEMSFHLQTNHDGNTVIVKKNNQVIQRLAPSKAFNLLKRISQGENDSPIKGGILNIKL